MTDTLSSILADEYVDDSVEIIILDDCSDLNYEPYIRDIFGARIQYCRNPRNIGITDNHNRAISIASGEFVHILHQDDEIMPGFYRATIPPLKNDAENSAVFVRTDIIDEHGKFVRRQHCEIAEPGALENWQSKISQQQRIFFPSIVVRRSVYESVGGLNSALSFAFDWEMWSNISATGHIWYIPEILAKYRVHNQSTTQELSVFEKTIDRLRAIAYIYAGSIDKRRGDLMHGSIFRVFYEVWTAEFRAILKEGAEFHRTPLTDFLTQGQSGDMLFGALNNLLEKLRTR
jgi:glycosyltransferase involved in cell wall biosynthesis